MEYRIDDLILELHLIHKQLNIYLFENSLKNVNIAIETSKRRNRLTLGHFDPNEDWLNKKNQITIWTLALNGNYISIISTLVHEMVHQYNFEHNIKDVENNQRHNLKFKKIAEEKAKLKVFSKNNKGYAFTEPSEQLIYYIEHVLDFNKDVFKKMVHKDAINYFPKNYAKKKPLICPNCGFDINKVEKK